MKSNILIWFGSLCHWGRKRERGKMKLFSCPLRNVFSGSMSSVRASFEDMMTDTESNSTRWRWKPAITDWEILSAIIIKIKTPNLSFKQWASYLGNVGSLSPPEIKFGEVPEGVLRLGGTLFVHKNNVKYQWNDRIPGDYPDISTVLKIAKQNGHLRP